MKFEKLFIFYNYVFVKKIICDTCDKFVIKFLKIIRETLLKFRISFNNVVYREMLLSIEKIKRKK